MSSQPNQHQERRQVPLLAELSTTAVEALATGTSSGGILTDGNLTSGDATSASPAGSDVVVVQPIGAVEQHGPHLPVATDAILAEHLARQAAAATDAAAWVLPTLHYGTSGEHLGWPGTFSLSIPTLIATCRDLARSVRASGFTRLVLVNGHGGQLHILAAIARELRLEFGLQVMAIQPGMLGVPESVTVPDAEWGIHAGALETSMMLHVAPHLVTMDAAAPGGGPAHEMYRNSPLLTIENGVSPAWITDDVSPANGVVGDPTEATLELGQVVVQHQITRLAAAFEEFSTFSFPSGR